MKTLLQRCIAFFFIMLSSNLFYAQPNTSALIPMPNHIEQGRENQYFTFNEKTSIDISDVSLSFASEQLQKTLIEQIGINPQISPSSNNTICLTLDSKIQNQEHYTIDVSEKRIEIKGKDKNAVFLGLMTFNQILLGDKLNTLQKRIATIKIDDQPILPQRILMLDPARHFIPVEDAKHFINTMAKYKYNILQLHLTDDQGWRVEIKKYPQLTDIGAVRNAKGGMNGPDNGFYTQNELRELVAYAEQRNVEIVPELDIPGHTVAILKAYPQLACSHVQNTEMIIGKTTNLMLCANNQEVYEIYENVIKEIADIFPSKYIHLGGDESVIDRNWGKCDKCQALKDELAYLKTSDLMNYFFDKILSSIKKHNKEAILWCELDNIYPPAKELLFPYPQDVTLVSWRGGLTPTCMQLTKESGHKLILAPGEYTYLDYPQYKNDFPEFNNWGMPTTTLEKSYQFDPFYGKNKSEHPNVIGVSGTLWGEAMKDINRVTYMTYPRAFAVAEAGWTKMEYRSWESFKKRIYPNLYDLMLHGVSVRVPFEIENRNY